MCMLLDTSRRGADWNSPTQKAMELGIFEIKEKGFRVEPQPPSRTTANERPTPTTMIPPAKQAWRQRAGYTREGKLIK